MFGVTRTLIAWQLVCQLHTIRTGKARWMVHSAELLGVSDGAWPLGGTGVLRAQGPAPEASSPGALGRAAEQRVSCWGEAVGLVPQENFHQRGAWSHTAQSAQVMFWAEWRWWFWH